jgi:hypothetical protein
MATKALSTFESKLNGAIIESLKACMEEPEGDDGPDWSAYDDFVAHLSLNIQHHAKELVKSLEVNVPKVTASKGSKSGSDTKRQNTYTQWVRVASHIRKGDISGNEEVTIGANFRDKSTASATKYFEKRDDLELEGKTMTVKELLSHLKSSMPDEKDLTLTAICWGLMPKDFRDELVSNHA